LCEAIKDSNKSDRRNEPSRSENKSKQRATKELKERDNNNNNNNKKAILKVITVNSKATEFKIRIESVSQLKN